MVREVKEEIGKEKNVRDVVLISVDKAMSGDGRLYWRVAGRAKYCLPKFA